MKTALFEEYYGHQDGGCKFYTQEGRCSHRGAARPNQSYCIGKGDCEGRNDGEEMRMGEQLLLTKRDLADLIGDALQDLVNNECPQCHCLLEPKDYIDKDDIERWINTKFLGKLK